MSTTNKSKANFYTLLVYSLGTIPVGIKNNLLGSFLLVYFNQVLGLSAQLAASAMAIAAPLPKPFVAPVIKAVFPFKFISLR